MQPTLRILIVDDDRRMTRTLADILTISGYQAVEASSGAEALAAINTQAFDCVLTDIKMPEMNGVELHSRLREAQPGLPVLLMTACAAEELIHQGLEEGVVGVFDKPLDINHLLSFFSSLASHRAVVVVDDDQAFCMTLADILSQRGFKVEQVHNPTLNVESIASDAQVILLDLKLNGLSGLDVLKEIRKKYPQLPVLLVTGYRHEMAASIQAALEINACLYKPLEIPRLLQLLTDTQLGRLRKVLRKI